MRIFYLHGMGGGPEDWERVQALLPGEALPIPREKSFHDTAKALEHILRATAGPLLLCGYSMGGRLAMEIAANLDAGILKGVALLSAGMGFSDEDSRRERGEKDRHWAALARRDPLQFWQNWYNQELFSGFHDLPIAMKSAWLEKRFSIDIDTLCHQLTSLSPAEHGFLLPSLLASKARGISVLYIAGERDKKYKNLANSLAEKGIKTETLQGGHILPLEAPEAVAESLKRFHGRIIKGI